MDNSLTNTNEIQNSIHRSCEAKYQNLKSDYEELEEHKRQILAIRDDQISKYGKQINNFENDIEKLNESLSETIKKLNQQEKIAIEANKSKEESKALQELTENKLNEFIKQWKEIDLTEFNENSNVNTEKIKKCISSYRNDLKIFNEKVVVLEESLKNLESKNEMINRILDNEKKSRQSWFSLGIFGKRNDDITNIDCKSLRINEDDGKTNSFTKILTIYNYEKEELLKKNEEYQMRVNHLEKELEKEKNFCKNLREKVKEFKDETHRLETQNSNISTNELKEKLEIKEEELKQKSKSILELTEKIRTLEKILQKTEENNISLSRDKTDIQRKCDLINLEYEQLLLKKESLEIHISDLEKSKSDVAVKQMKIFENKSRTSKTFEDEITEIKNDIIFREKDSSNQKKTEIPFDYVQWGLCQKYFHPKEIEQHFNSCIIDN